MGSIFQERLAPASSKINVGIQKRKKLEKGNSASEKRKRTTNWQEKWNTVCVSWMRYLEKRDQQIGYHRTLRKRSTEFQVTKEEGKCTGSGWNRNFWGWRLSSVISQLKVDECWSQTNFIFFFWVWVWAKAAFISYFWAYLCSCDLSFVQIEDKSQYEKIQHLILKSKDPGDAT